MGNKKKIIEIRISSWISEKLKKLDMRGQSEKMKLEELERKIVKNKETREN